MAKCLTCVVGFLYICFIKIIELLITLKFKNMKKIILKIGDNIRTYSGTFGTVSEINFATYEVNLSGDHLAYENWHHIRNIRFVNDCDTETNNNEIVIDREKSLIR